MQYRKGRAALHWISTFLNVTLHCCTPAHAENIHGLSAVATGPDHETSFAYLGTPAQIPRNLADRLRLWGDSGAPALIVSSTLSRTVLLAEELSMAHAAIVNFGIFPAGHRVEVGGYDLCREGARDDRLAVFGKGENQPVTYITPGVKSSFEALVWLDGFRSSHWHGSEVGHQGDFPELQGYAAGNSIRDRRGRIAFDNDTSSRTQRDRSAIRPRQRDASGVHSFDPAGYSRPGPLARPLSAGTCLRGIAVGALRRDFCERSLAKTRRATRVEIRRYLSDNT